MKKLRHKLAQALEYQWWKSYLGKRDEADYRGWKTDYWQQFLHHLPEGLLKKDSQQLADLGCGPAGIFMVLGRHQLTALDPLIDQYGKLEHFNPDEYPWVIFRPGEIESFSGNYDGIFCLNAINHVADLEKALDAIASSIKPGGWLVLSTDVHKRRLTRNIFKACSWIDPLHPQQDDRQDYEKHFARLGLSIDTSFAYGGNFLFEYRVWVLRKPKEE